MNNKSTVENIIQLKNQVVQILSDANDGAAPLRQVSLHTALTVVARSMQNSTGAPFAVAEYRALRDLEAFITLAQENRFTGFASNTDLLPLAHPSSTARHAMTAGALAHARLRWYSGEDKELLALTASAVSKSVDSAEFKYVASRLTAAGYGDMILEAITAAGFGGGGNSYWERRMRAMKQRRDRLGRFAFMGGGFHHLIRGLDGSTRWKTGRVVGASEDGTTVDIEYPDGTIARLPADKGEALKATLTQGEEKPVKVSASDAKYVIDQNDVQFVDAPEDWQAWGDEATTSDGGKVQRFLHASGEYSVARKVNPDGTTEFSILDERDQYQRKAVGDIAKSWADVADMIRDNTSSAEKEDVKARLLSEDATPMSPEDIADLFDAQEQGAKPKAEEAPAEKKPTGAPPRAYVLQLDSFEPEGYQGQESTDYTDDPTELAQRFDKKDLAFALRKAVIPPTGAKSDVYATGYGTLPFDEGDEQVPAEALFLALKKQKINAQKFLDATYQKFADEQGYDFVPESAAKAELPATPKPAAPAAPKPAAPAKEEYTPEEQAMWKAVGEYGRLWKGYAYHGTVSREEFIQKSRDLYNNGDEATKAKLLESQDSALARTENIVGFELPRMDTPPAPPTPVDEYNNLVNSIVNGKIKFRSFAQAARALFLESDPETKAALLDAQKKAMAEHGDIIVEAMWEPPAPSKEKPAAPKPAAPAKEEYTPEEQAMWKAVGEYGRLWKGYAYHGTVSREEFIQKSRDLYNNGDEATKAKLLESQDSALARTENIVGFELPRMDEVVAPAPDNAPEAEPVTTGQEDLPPANPPAGWKEGPMSPDGQISDDRKWVWFNPMAHSMKYTKDGKVVDKLGGTGPARWVKRDQTVLDIERANRERDFNEPMPTQPPAGWDPKAMPGNDGQRSPDNNWQWFDPRAHAMRQRQDGKMVDARGGVGEGARWVERNPHPADIAINGSKNPLEKPATPAETVDLSFESGDLRQQIEDAIAKGNKIRFSYNGTLRTLTPEEIKIGKGDNINVIGVDQNGDTKAFTISKMQKSSEALDFQPDMTAEQAIAEAAGSGNLTDAEISAMMQGEGIPDDYDAETVKAPEEVKPEPKNWWEGVPEIGGGWKLKVVNEYNYKMKKNDREVMYSKTFDGFSVWVTKSPTGVWRISMQHLYGENPFDLPDYTLTGMHMGGIPRQTTVTPDAESLDALAAEFKNIGQIEHRKRFAAWLKSWGADQSLIDMAENAPAQELEDAIKSSGLIEKLKQQHDDAIKDYQFNDAYGAYKQLQKGKQGYEVISAYLGSFTDVRPPKTAADFPTLFPEQAPTNIQPEVVATPAPVDMPKPLGAPRRAKVRVSDLQPGDVLVNDHFVVESVFSDAESEAKKPGSVWVTGYYPGHESQQTKLWYPEDTREVYRDVVAPEKGDQPLLSKPDMKSFGKLTKVDGEWRVKDEAGQAAYEAAKAEYDAKLVEAMGKWTAPAVAPMVDFTQEAPKVTKLDVAASDIKPGDIAYGTENPNVSTGVSSFNHYFVVDEVFEPTPEQIAQSPDLAGKVGVRGHFPGHKQQEKFWNPTTPISVIRGADAPAAGDGEELHRPNLKKDAKYQNPDGTKNMELYRADAKKYYEDKKASSALFEDPVIADPQPPVPTEPKKPGRSPQAPAFMGDYLQELVRKANGDPLKLKELLDNEEVVYFDFETTGQNKNFGPDSRPIQVAAYKIKNGEIVDKIDLFMNPGEPLADFYYTTDENGNKVLNTTILTPDGQMISDDFLSQQPTVEDAMAKFFEWMGPNPILGGQNVAGFDEPILRYIADSIGVPYEYKGMIDSQSLAKSALPDGTKIRLGDLTSRYNVQLEGWHDARADALAVHGVINGLLEEMGKTGSGSIELDPDARRAIYEKALEDYNKKVEAYKAFKEAQNASMIESALKGDVTPTLDELVKNLDTTPAPNVDGIFNNPAEAENPPAGVPVEIPPGGKNVAWVKDDNNTSLIDGKIRPEDFKVGDFFPVKDGSTFHEIIGITEDPNNPDFLFIQTKILGTDTEYTKHYMRWNKVFSGVRRPVDSYEGDPIPDPQNSVESPAATEVPSAPEGVDLIDALANPIDISGWTKVGGQKGTNSGGIFEDAEGKKYYVKFPASEDLARNEALASALYSAAGVKTSRTVLGKNGNGNIVLVSPWIDDSKSDFDERRSEPSILESAQRAFAVDAWLANWDVVGAAYDNMLLVGDDVVRVDAGGALRYRAQGGEKNINFSDHSVSEIDSMRSRGTAKYIFGNMTDEQIAESVKLVEAVSPETIDQLAAAAFPDSPAIADMYAGWLKARRLDLSNRFGELGKQNAENNKAAQELAAKKKAISEGYKAVTPDTNYEDVLDMMSKDSAVKDLVMSGKKNVNGTIEELKFSVYDESDPTNHAEITITPSKKEPGKFDVRISGTLLDMTDTEWEKYKKTLDFSSAMEDVGLLIPQAKNKISEKGGSPILGEPRGVAPEDSPIQKSPIDNLVDAVETLQNDVSGATVGTFYSDPKGPSITAKIFDANGVEQQFTIQHINNKYSVFGLNGDDVLTRIYEFDSAEEAVEAVKTEFDNFVNPPAKEKAPELPADMPLKESVSAIENAIADLGGQVIYNTDTETIGIVHNDYPAIGINITDEGGKFYVEGWGLDPDKPMGSEALGASSDLNEAISFAVRGLDASIKLHKSKNNDTDVQKNAPENTVSADYVEDALEGSPIPTPSAEQLQDEVQAEKAAKKAAMKDPSLIVQELKKKYPFYYILPNGHMVLSKQNVTYDGVDYTYELVVARNSDESFTTYGIETNTTTGEQRYILYKRGNRRQSMYALENKIAEIGFMMNADDPRSFMNKVPKKHVKGSLSEFDFYVEGAIDVDSPSYSANKPETPNDSIAAEGEFIKSAEFPATGDALTDSLLTIVKNMLQNETMSMTALDALYNVPGISKDTVDRVRAIVLDVAFSPNKNTPAGGKASSTLSGKPHVSADGVYVEVGMKVKHKSKRADEVGVVVQLVGLQQTNEFGYTDYVWVMYPGDKKPTKRTAKNLHVVDDNGDVVTSNPETVSAPEAVSAPETAPEPVEAKAPEVAPAAPESSVEAVQPVPVMENIEATLSEDDLKKGYATLLSGSDAVEIMVNKDAILHAALTNDYKEKYLSELMPGDMIEVLDKYGDKVVAQILKVEVTDGVAHFSYAYVLSNSDNTLVYSIHANLPPSLKFNAVTPSKTPAEYVELVKKYDTSDSPSAPDEVVKVVKAVNDAAKANPDAAEGLDTAAVDEAVSAAEKKLSAGSDMELPDGKITPEFAAEHLDQFIQVPMRWEDIKPGDVMVHGTYWDADANKHLPERYLVLTEPSSNGSGAHTFERQRLRDGKISTESVYDNYLHHYVTSQTVLRHKSKAEDPFEFSVEEVSFAESKKTSLFKNIKKLATSDLQVGDLIPVGTGPERHYLQVLAVHKVNYRNHGISYQKTFMTYRIIRQDPSHPDHGKIRTAGTQYFYNNVKRMTEAKASTTVKSKKPKKQSSAPTSNTSVPLGKTPNGVSLFNTPEDLANAGSYDKKESKLYKDLGADTYDEFKYAFKDSGLIAKDGSSDKKYLFPGMVVSDKDTGSGGIVTDVTSLDSVTVTWMSGPKAGQSETLKSDTMLSQGRMFDVESAAKLGVDISPNFKDTIVDKIEKRRKAKEEADKKHAEALKAAQEAAKLQAEAKKAAQEAFEENYPNASGADPVVVTTPTPLDISNFEGVMSVKEALESAKSDGLHKREGVVTAVDSDAIEDSKVTIQQIMTDKGDLATRVTFKLTDWAGKKHSKLLEELVSQGEGQVSDSLDVLIYQTALDANGNTILMDSGSFIPQWGDKFGIEGKDKGRTFTIPVKNASGEVIGYKRFHRAIKGNGSVDYTKTGTGSTGPAVVFNNAVELIMKDGVTEQEIMDAIAASGVPDARPATAADMRVLAENKLIQTFYPKQSDATRNLSGAEREKALKHIVETYGLTADDVSVVPTNNGRNFNLLLSREMGEKLAEMAGLQYFKHRLASAGHMNIDSVIDKLSQDGLKGVFNRWMNGYNKGGMSSPSDITRAGGNAVYTYLGYGDYKTKAYAVAHPDQGSIYFDAAEMLRRLDYHSNSGDGWGAKQVGVSAFEKIKDSQGEAMFKEYVPWGSVLRIGMSPDMAQKVYEHFVQLGITEIDGRSIKEMLGL